MCMYAEREREREGERCRKKREETERKRSANQRRIGLIVQRRCSLTFLSTAPTPLENSPKTQTQDGTPIPVRITAYADKSYDYSMKTPPTSHLLKSAAGVAKGAQKPGHASGVVGSVSAATVVEIAKIKAADLPPHVPLRSVAKSVAATARSMGVKVVGEV